MADADADAEIDGRAMDGRVAPAPVAAIVVSAAAWLRLLLLGSGLDCATAAGAAHVLSKSVQPPPAAIRACSLRMRAMSSSVNWSAATCSAVSFTGGSRNWLGPVPLLPMVGGGDGGARDILVFYLCL